MDNPVLGGEPVLGSEPVGFSRWTNCFTVVGDDKVRLLNGPRFCREFGEMRTLNGDCGGGDSGVELSLNNLWRGKLSVGAKVALRNGRRGLLSASVTFGLDGGDSSFFSILIQA